MINRDRNPVILNLWARSCDRFGHRFEEDPMLAGRTCRRCLEWQPTWKQRFGQIKITGREEHPSGSDL